MIAKPISVPHSIDLTELPKPSKLNAIRQTKLMQRLLDKRQWTTFPLFKKLLGIDEKSKLLRQALSEAKRDPQVKFLLAKQPHDFILHFNSLLLEMTKEQETLNKLSMENEISKLQENINKLENELKQEEVTRNKVKEEKVKKMLYKNMAELEAALYMQEQTKTEIENIAEKLLSNRVKILSTARLKPNYFFANFTTWFSSRAKLEIINKKELDIVKPIFTSFVNEIFVPKYGKKAINYLAYFATDLYYGQVYRKKELAIKLFDSLPADILKAMLNSKYLKSGTQTKINEFYAKNKEKEDKEQTK